MSLILEKLRASHRFNLETDKLGKLLVHGFSSSVLSSLIKDFTKIIDSDSTRFVRKLSTLVCQQDINESGNYTDDRITQEQAELLSKEELERFSAQFIEKNSSIRKIVRNEKKNEDSEQRTTLTQDYRGDSEERESGSYQDYLKCLIHDYRIDQEERTKKLYENLVGPKSLFSDSLVGLINENRKISERLGSSINRYDSIKIISPPENPVLETNKQLNAIGAEFSETSRLVKNMNDLGLQMAIEVAEGAKTSKRHNTIMIVLGLLTLLFSAVMSYLSYVSSSESASEIQKLLSNSFEIQKLAIQNNQVDQQLVRDQLNNVSYTLKMIETDQNNISAHIEQLNSKVGGIPRTTGK